MATVCKVKYDYLLQNNDLIVGIKLFSVWISVNNVQFTSMAMVSSSLMSCRAPTSSQVTSGTVAKPSLLAEGWTLAREDWKSDMRMDRLANSSSDSVSVFFNRSNK